jgi:hypothetical protein
MLAFRLGAFTLSLLLLSDAIEPNWGWHAGLALLTLAIVRELVRLVAFVLSACLLLGIVDGSEAAYIALTIFTGAVLGMGLVRSLAGPRIPSFAVGGIFRRHG